MGEIKYLFKSVFNFRRHVHWNRFSILYLWSRSGSRWSYLL